MKIICIGRNYSEHAKELGNSVPTEPVIFCKQDSSVLARNNPLYIPEWTSDLHYEVELIIKIDRLGKYVEKQFASRYYSTVGLGLDFTARDLQEDLKKKGLPWEKAKSFDGSAVIGKEFILLEELPDRTNIRFQLKKNGEVVQDGSSKDMIFDFDSIVENVSKYFTLKIGDLIYTGTPSGVGKVEAGDVLEGFLENKKMFRVVIK